MGQKDHNVTACLAVSSVNGLVSYKIYRGGLNMENFFISFIEIFSGNLIGVNADNAFGYLILTMPAHTEKLKILTFN